MLSSSVAKFGLVQVRRLSRSCSNLASSPANTRRREARRLERLEILSATSARSAFKLDLRLWLGSMKLRITEKSPPIRRKRNTIKSVQNSRTLPELAARCVLMLKVLLLTTMRSVVFAVETESLFPHVEQAWSSTLLSRSRPSPIWSLNRPTNQRRNHLHRGEKTRSLNPLAGMTM